MKRTNTITLFVGLMCLMGCIHPEVVDHLHNTLETRNGLLYKMGELTPYTGEFVAKHTNGRLLFRDTIRAGRIQEHTAWYETGQMAERTEYSNGQPITLSRWHENGTRMVDGRYTEGLLTEVTTWDKSGKMLQHLKGGPFRSFHGSAYYEYKPNEAGNTNASIQILQ